MDGCIAGSRRGIALHARVIKIIYRSPPAAYSPIRAACTRCLRVLLFVRTVLRLFVFVVAVGNSAVLRRRGRHVRPFSSRLTVSNVSVFVIQSSARRPRRSNFKQRVAQSRRQTFIADTQKLPLI